MTSTSEFIDGYAYRRAYRPAHGRMVGGVAQGLATHFGVGALWIRVAFVVGTWINALVAIGIYALLWRLLPIDERDDADEPAGIAAATRSGLRTPGARTSSLLSDPLQTAALLTLGVGVLMLNPAAGWGWGLGSGLIVPVLVGIAGLVIAWRQADETTRSSWVTQPSGWAAMARLAAGIALVTIAAVFAVAQSSGMDDLLDASAMLVMAALGLALLTGPWIYRLTRELGEERAERIRTQERADVAAHLHDSVLQTLAILQKNAHDSRIVSTLARRQERELRDWLYGSPAPSESTLRSALDAAARQVEDDHGVPVEIVTVGDIALNPDGDALVRASREAIVNAAKHSGAASIDVYAEVGSADVDVFVRDRGAGFDPDTVGDSTGGTQMGIRESIVARMDRHGGSATIRSAPGDGTEVRVSMPKDRFDEGEQQ